MRRRLAFASATALKIVAAALPLYFSYPLGVRFAESWMGVRAQVDGFGGGLLVAAAVVAAFVASSALAASGTGRACTLRAARATALLVTATAAFVLVTWLVRIPSPPYGHEMIVTQSYVKYPPIRAASLLGDIVRPVGLAILFADIVMTIAIVGASGPRNGAARRGTASTADTSTATS